MSLQITATIRLRDGSRRVLECSGRIAQTLECLVAAGSKGITALEMATWAIRLSHYVWVLRHRHGVSIGTQFETHGGAYPGKHPRYTPLDQVCIEAGDSRRDAA